MVSFMCKTIVQEIIQDPEEREIAAAAAIFTFYYQNFKIIVGVSGYDRQEIECTTSSNSYP